MKSWLKVGGKIRSLVVGKLGSNVCQPFLRALGEGRGMGRCGTHAVLSVAGATAPRASLNVSQGRPIPRMTAAGRANPYSTVSLEEDGLHMVTMSGVNGFGNGKVHTRHSAETVSSEWPVQH